MYHLARATDASTWRDYVATDVEPTVRVGEACLRHGVRRLVYTGSIASVDTSRSGAMIQDDTLLDHRLERRLPYARAKGTGERVLLQMHRDHGLPVVVLRPGIVVGGTGDPCHLGVGMWWGYGVCRFWGDGTTPLPLVLNSDVAAALVAAGQRSGIDGRCYNLSAQQSITAREYVTEMERAGGFRIDARGVPIARWYREDLLKWVVKVLVRHPGRSRRPSFHDWDCRSQNATFDCSAARRDLGWTPVDDRDTLIRAGIHAPVQAMLE